MPPLTWLFQPIKCSDFRSMIPNWGWELVSKARGHKTSCRLSQLWIKMRVSFPGESFTTEKKKPGIQFFEQLLKKLLQKPFSVSINKTKQIYLWRLCGSWEDTSVSRFGCSRPILPITESSSLSLWHSWNIKWVIFRYCVWKCHFTASTSGEQSLKATGSDEIHNVSCRLLLRRDRLWRVQVGHQLQQNRARKHNSYILECVFSPWVTLEVSHTKPICEITRLYGGTLKWRIRTSQATKKAITLLEWTLITERRTQKRLQKWYCCQQAWNAAFRDV